MQAFIYNWSFAEINIGVRDALLKNLILLKKKNLKKAIILEFGPGLYVG